MIKPFNHRNLLSTVPFVLVFLCGTSVWASTSSVADSVAKADKAQNVYVELLGPSGSYYSINYDTRFENSHRGWGIRAGAGFIPERSGNVWTAPVQLNYLVGRARHLAEIGGGVTFYHSNIDEPIWGVVSDAGGAVFGTLSAGYRYQPLVKGVTFRAGATALFGGFQLPMPSAQLSVGYRF